MNYYVKRHTLKKLLLWTVALLIVLLLPQAVHAETTPITEDNPDEGIYQESWALTQDHVRYVDAESSGKFRPTAKLTRGEAAQMIYHLLAEAPAEHVYCADVTESDKHSKEISGLISLGIISPDSKNLYHPDKAITQKDFKNMIARCQNREETYTSTNSISRAAAVRYLNQRLGRQNTDKNTIKNGKSIRIFTDVPYGNTYYYDVLEASIGHSFDAENDVEKWISYDKENSGITGTGWKFFNGETYYVSTKTHLIMRNCTVSGNKLNRSGRFTTGDAKLDALLTKIIKSQTTDKMTQKERLKKCFQYVYKNCKYRADVKRKIGTNSWDRKAAYTMLSTKKGNCYHFASAFTYLAKKCGYNAKTISGYIYYIPANAYFRHGWTEISLADGSKRVCDPEIQYINYTGNGTNDYFYRTYTTTTKKLHYYYYKMGQKCK